MDIVVVSGSASGVGKTTLISRFVSSTGSLTGVIKTSLQDQQEQRVVTADRAVITTPGADTYIFRQAGADRVVFLRSTSIYLQRDLNRALELIGEVETLFIEGNSVLDYLSPDLLIYLERTQAETKPSAVRARARADLIFNLDLFSDFPDAYQGDDKRLQLFDYLQSEIKGEADRTGEAGGLISLPTGRMTCYQAHLLAGILGLEPVIIGGWLDRTGVRVKECQLGLF